MLSGCAFLPGGRATISIPVAARSSGSVRLRRAKPPPKSCRKRAPKAVSRAAKVDRNCVAIMAFSCSIRARVLEIACVRSDRCASRPSNRVLMASYSSAAKGFGAPSSWKRRRNAASLAVPG